MKKKLSMLVILTLIFTFTLSIPCYAAQASDAEATESTEWVTYEYFDDGSCIMTTIAVSPAAALSDSYETATKTGAYLNSDGEVLWSATITASFVYTGTISTCTASSVSTSFYSSAWKLVNSSASRYGYTATATAEGKYYFAGVPIASKTISLTLSCDKNGNLT